MRKKEIKLPLFNQCNDLITVLHYIDEHFCHFFLHNLLGSQIQSTLARTLISHLFSFPLSFKFQWTPYSTSSNDSQYSPTHEWCLKVEIANWYSCAGHNILSKRHSYIQCHIGTLRQTIILLDYWIYSTILDTIHEAASFLPFTAY